MKIVKLYAKGGFQVKVVLMDKEFDKIRDAVGHLEINTTAAREHVAKIERQIRTVKERMRCGTSSLLSCGIKHLHKQIVIHLVYDVTLKLNSFPRKQSLSLNFLPREIVMQRSISLDDKCNAEFGSYVQATTDAVVTNDQQPQTHGCMALGPSGN